MKTLVINFKNYREVLGPGSLRLAAAAAKVASKSSAEIIVAPPNSMLGAVVSKVSIPVFSQSVGGETGEKTTGGDLPEAARAAGAVGTLLNHSEARRPLSELKALVPRAMKSGLKVCLCANGSRESATLSVLGSEYIAVEPPELIGSGVAVSRAKPEAVKATVEAARKSGYRGAILCGAGIVDGDDVRRAIELGADGVLVSSSIVKARDWSMKIGELARSLD
ncbi:MAG TPA: triose-phosphate isomerase [Nitrososphaerales archaeon]|nr:triose-phosphate isomerase [Nitrososphaerales archaeon]